MTYETKLSPKAEPAHPSVDLFNKAKQFVLAPLKRFERDREGQMPKLDCANVEVSIEANDVKANDVANQVKSSVTSSKVKKRRAKSRGAKRLRAKSSPAKAARVAKVTAKGQSARDWSDKSQHSRQLSNVGLDQLVIRLLHTPEKNLAKFDYWDLERVAERVEGLGKGLRSVMAKMRQEAEVQRQISLRAVREMVRRRELGQL